MNLHERHEEFTKLAYEKETLMPDRYVFIITNKCNLNCSFCYQDKNHKSKDLDISYWKYITNQIPEYARVTISGGEPLLYKDFTKIFSYVAERFDCNIISNGTLLNKETIDLMLSFPKFKILSISIDDIGNISRNFTDKQWNRLVEMLKYFVDKRDEMNSDCVLDIKTTILDRNAEYLFEMYKYFSGEMRCDTHAFNLLKGSIIQHTDYDFEFKDALEKTDATLYEQFDMIKKQLELVKEYSVKNNTRSYIHPSIGNIDLLNTKEHKKENFLPCKYPWSSVHINYDGNVYPCLAIPMGNIKNSSLRDIVFGEEFLKFKSVIRKEGTINGCNNCGWLRCGNN